MSPALDAGERSAVESYVSSTLQSMPEHLRAGVAAESILLGGRSWVERWKTSKLDPVRQYVRLLHSLVLFAENELAADGT
jgi:hypothetical protein